MENADDLVSAKVQAGQQFSRVTAYIQKFYIGIGFFNVIFL